MSSTVMSGIRQKKATSSITCWFSSGPSTTLTLPRWAERPEDLVGTGPYAITRDPT